MSAFLVRALFGAVLLFGVFTDLGQPVAAVTESNEPGESRPGVGLVTAVPSAYLETDSAYGCESTPIYRVYRVTAYCDRGLTAAGIFSGVGQCAAPADIPFGSRVYIPSLDTTFIVTDRTAKRYRHSTVDLFMPGRKQCLEFGCRYLECEIRSPSRAPQYGSPELYGAIDSVSE